MSITAANLKDFNWRMNNLYRIISDDGVDTPFILNAAQRDILRDMWFRNVILKSRKHGCTTLVDLLGMDTALFQSNQDFQIISETLPSATKIFRRIIMHTYDGLPDEVKAICPIESKTQTQIVLKNGSSISVGTTARSTSPTFLHVSEYGRIAFKWPDKAMEILTGAIQAVAATGSQMVWVEATAMGHTGAFKEMIDRARKLRDTGQSLSKLDMKLLFYPWYEKKENRVEGSGQVVSEKMEEYFSKLPITLDESQKKWYCTQFEQIGPYMFTEHPSTEDEPFTVAIEGAYFIHQFKKIYADGRIGKFPVVEGIPIHTSWDIGMHDYMSIWFIQVVDGMPRAVDYYENNNQGLEHYAGVLEGRGYRYGTHYAPHDINVKEVGSGRTRLEQAHDMGLNFKPVPRIGKKMDAIEAARKLLDFMRFDEVSCADGIEHLEQYRKKWSPLTNGWSDEPAETGDQHGADALMTFAQGHGLKFAGKEILTGKRSSQWNAWDA